MKPRGVRPATALFVSMLVLSLLQAFYSLERFKVQDSRIRYLEDRLRALESGAEVQHAF